MKIIVKDKAERTIIESMIDIAMRQGGIRNLKEINQVYDSIEDEKPKEKEQ